MKIAPYTLATLYTFATLLVLVGCGSPKTILSTNPEVLIYRPNIPSPSDVATTWFGKTSDDLYYYRLILFESGEGTLVYNFAQDPSQPLPVTSWNLRDRNITVQVDASRTVLKPVSILGTAGVNYLQLSISGSGWEQAVKFIKEEDFERRYSKLKAVEK